MRLDLALKTLTGSVDPEKGWGKTGLHHNASPMTIQRFPRQYPQTLVDRGVSAAYYDASKKRGNGL